MKKPVEKIAIFTGICMHSIIPLILLGSLTNGATWCNHTREVVSETLSTCTKQGKIVEYCSECDINFTTYKDRLPHNYYLSDTIDATCDTRGRIIEKCTMCSSSRKTITDALGHNMKETSRREPTHNKDGEIILQCERCGHTEKQSIDKLPPLTMVQQFIALGFSENEAKEMKDIFSVVGITEINNIQKGPGSGIDDLQSFICNIFDYDKSKGGLSLHFTIENRQLCYISLDGIPTQKIDYFYINIFGDVTATISNSKKSVVMYDIWDENGEIDPNAIGYKAVFDYDNMKISSYKNKNYNPSYSMD